MTHKLLLLMALVALVSCGQKGNDPDPEPEPEPEYNIPAPNLPYTVSPYGAGVCTDAYFSLTFSSAPTLGESGCIRIYEEDGTLVDEIDLADVAAASDDQITGATIYTTAFNALKSGSYYRIVRYKPVSISGRTVTIRPHNSKLDFGTVYYITIDDTAIVADQFDGITEGDAWVIRTAAKPESTTLSVGSTSDCDFRTVQGALSYASSLGQSTEVTINVADGIYEEQLYLRDKRNVTIKGESREGTIIRERNSEALANGTGQGSNVAPRVGNAINRHGGRAVILVESCDMLRFEDITLENTYGDGSQAEVIYNNDNDGTGRIIFVNCKLTSEQDTICTKGWGWFYNCRITGDVDFIWGYPQTVLFENCEIVSCASGRGYIVQSRCQSSTGKGFVFLNCNLTAAAGVSSVYLARSGGSSDYYDNVTYINCTMGSHITSAGWYTSPAPNPASANYSRGWKEYGSLSASGSELDLSSRASCAYILSDSEYRSGWATRDIILTGAPSGSSWCE